LTDKYPWNHPERKEKLKEFQKKHGIGKKKSGPKKPRTKKRRNIDDLSPNERKDYNELIEKYPWNHPQRKKKMDEFKKKHGLG
jgi:predicted transcriptional regulator